MLNAILKALFGGTLESAGGALANGAKWAAVAAMVPALWNWYNQHGAETAVSLTWGQLFFFSAMVFAIVQVAHNARPQ